MESIITTVAICIAIPLVFQLFYFLRSQEEKKYENKKFVRTRMPKSIQFFFLGFAIIVFVIMIIATAFLIKAEEPLSTILIVLGVCSLFILLGLFGFCLTRFNYEIVENNEIIVVRCFRKNRRVNFDDIRYYSYLPGFIGGLIGYGMSGIPLVKSEGGNIGIEAFVEEFRIRQIALITNAKSFPDILPPERQTVYSAYKQRKNLKVSGWILFVVGVVMMGMFGMACGINGTLLHDYENYPVTGIVESYDFGGGTLKIKFYGDDNNYYVNDVVHGAVNKNFESIAKQGDELTLTIAYTDGRGRLNISQIELKGEIYLDKDEAQTAELDNYNLGIITQYVFLGLSCAGLIAALGCLTAVKVKFGNIQIDNT